MRFGHTFLVKNRPNNARPIYSLKFESQKALIQCVVDPMNSIASKKYKLTFQNMLKYYGSQVRGLNKLCLLF